MNRKYSIVGMENPHIIVGPGRMCLCGAYDDKALFCGDIIRTLDAVGESQLPEALQTRFATVSDAFMSLVQDCPPATTPEGTTT